MASHSKYGRVDPHNPEAAGRCDRGGEIRKLRELQPQMRWAGDRLVATGWLVCRQHMDVPNPQDRAYRLRADPIPVRDPRPNIDLGSAANPTGDNLLDLSFYLDVSHLGDGL